MVKRLNAECRLRKSTTYATDSIITRLIRLETIASRGSLQRAGLISYIRGQMTILDRSGLEATACECYGIVQREFKRLLNGNGN